MTHTYGYARVSTTAQNLDAQVDALTGAGGVDEPDVIVENASGRREDRPKLDRLLAGLREGDTLVVTKLDRAQLFVCLLMGAGNQPPEVTAWSETYMRRLSENPAPGGVGSQFAWGAPPGSSGASHRESEPSSFGSSGILEARP